LHNKPKNPRDQYAEQITSKKRPLVSKAELHQAPDKTLLPKLYVEYPEDRIASGQPRLLSINKV
jgi:hypothetical protein